MSPENTVAPVRPRPPCKGERHRKTEALALKRVLTFPGCPRWLRMKLTAPISPRALEAGVDIQFLWTYAGPAYT